jgi:hypothetical protein
MQPTSKRVNNCTLALLRMHKCSTRKQNKRVFILIIQILIAIIINRVIIVSRLLFKCTITSSLRGTAILNDNNLPNYICAHSFLLQF